MSLIVSKIKIFLRGVFLKDAANISRINIKCTSTNKAIILGAHMFNIKPSRYRHEVLPYIKPPVTTELKKRVNFFGTKIRVFSEAKF